ncbi:hypothetical protein DS837_28125 [Azospirillum brasilense]|uniref:Uncharacterized protein n=1 Tax=Azospirillum brasilense TaxID=192 RepID=A0A6L3ASA5_AZOBR|nr:hypothetical protein DS837_28125 [Azospirillum brasilense]
MHPGDGGRSVPQDFVRDPLGVPIELGGVHDLPNGPGGNPPVLQQVGVQARFPGLQTVLKVGQQAAEACAETRDGPSWRINDIGIHQGQIQVGRVEELSSQLYETQAMTPCGVTTLTQRAGGMAARERVEPR